MRVACDNEKCTGCLACVVTCIDHHYSVDVNDPVSGRLYEKVISPNGYTRYLTRSCHHCADPECAQTCPVGAITKNDERWVVFDQEICIGCQVCRTACPFDIPRFNDQGKMFKCNGCNGDPSCIKICPNKALYLE